jgi:hypothetical protein
MMKVIKKETVYTLQINDNDMQQLCEILEDAAANDKFCGNPVPRFIEDFLNEGLKNEIQD